jgi:flagellar biosynthetic protein FliO
LKIFSANKTLKYISYYLLILVFTLSLNWTNLGIAQTSNDTQKTSNIVAVDEDKPISEIYKKRQKENLISPVNVFSNLLTLILIMFTIAWLYQKYGQNILSKALKTKNLNINSINLVSTLPIGQNKYLHIIEVDDERMLVGATNNHISLIKSLKNSPKEKVVSDE